MSEDDLFHECMPESLDTHEEFHDCASIPNHQIKSPEEISHDCQKEIFQDCIDQPVNSKAFHLSIDYQLLGNQKKGSQYKVQYIRSHEVDEMLTALK